MTDELSPREKEELDRLDEIISNEIRKRGGKLRWNMIEIPEVKQ